MDESANAYGWLSKLWSLFWYPKYWVPHYNRDPKRDHYFDNHPYISRQVDRIWRTCGSYDIYPKPYSIYLRGA